MKHSKLVLPALLLAVVALALLGANLLSIGADRAPDITWSDDGGSGVVNFTLPADREAVKVIGTVRFDTQPGSQYLDARPVTAVATARSTDESSTSSRSFDHGLYGLPSWTDVHDVKVVATVAGTARCGSDERAYSGFDFAYGANPVAGASFLCSASNNDYCPDSQLVYSRDRQTQFVNVGGYARTDITECRGSNPTTANTKTVEFIIPNEYIFDVSNVKTPTTSTKFLVSPWTRKSSNGGVASTTVNSVVVSFRRALYPTDVSYSVDGRFIEALSGRQYGETVTLDIAQQINSACRGGRDGSECTIPIEFNSRSGGRMWIEWETQYRIFEPSVPVETPGIHNTQPPLVGENEEPETGFIARFLAWLRGLFE